jgi:Cdc6-like AAA superfamily ATPase
MKVDVVDSFEKRVKSRFSHRQVILYDYSFETLRESIKKTIKDIHEEIKISKDDVQALELIYKALASGITEDMLVGV